MTARRKDLIYLTGFMASGKSTLGPILANTLGYDYIDLDAAVERGAGMSVARLFAEEGEAAFRAREREILLATCSTNNTVVALGGAIAHPGNLEIILGAGMLIYLRTDVEQIVRRLRQKTNRPLIVDTEGNPLPEEQLRERVVKLLAEREPFYLRAHMVVDTDTRRVGLTVDELVRRIRQY